MAYVDSRQRPSVGSMAAVVAVHGAVGAALILGLTVSGVIAPKPPRLTTIPQRTPPPPPPEPTATPTPTQAATKLPYQPPVPIPLPRPGPTPDSIDTLPRPTPPQPFPGTKPSPLPDPLPSFTPDTTLRVTPQGARPRNDPLGWVTASDYKGSWIRKELTGTARFRLDIAADGRVTNCTITASSGHAELDQATCALVARRARFNPARGGEGEPVAGRYTNAITWRLPE